MMTTMAVRFLKNITQKKTRFSLHCHFCNSSDADGMEFDRKRAPQSNEFYASEATQRKYYYVIDTRGHLFLESTKVRTPFTCLKDVKFLNFFYKHLQRVPAGLSSEYPLVSFCGKETSFVMPEDSKSVVVYSSFDWTSGHLFYGCGTTPISFDPNLLCWSRQTLRLYHPLTQHPRLVNELGLIHPTLAQKIANSIVWSDEIDGGIPFIIWDNRKIDLKVID